MKRSTLIFILFLWVTMANGSFAGSADALDVLNENLTVLEDDLIVYKEKYIDPQLRDGKGQSKNKPLVFAEPRTASDPTESRALAFAYAGLFCRQGEHEDAWVQFPAFNKASTSRIKGLVGFSGKTTTSLQCHQFLQDACKNGSCLSGKCGQSKSLATYCSLCDKEFPGTVDQCIRDFHYRQVLPQTSNGGMVNLGVRRDSAAFVSYAPPVRGPQPGFSSGMVSQRTPQGALQGAPQGYPADGVQSHPGNFSPQPPAGYEPAYPPVYAPRFSSDRQYFDGPDQLPPAGAFGPAFNQSQRAHVPPYGNSNPYGTMPPPPPVPLGPTYPNAGAYQMPAPGYSAPKGPYPTGGQSGRGNIVSNLVGAYVTGALLQPRHY